MEQFLYHCKYFGLSPDEACSLMALTHETDVHKTIRTFKTSIEHLFMNGFITYAEGAEKGQPIRKMFTLTEKGEKALVSIAGTFPQTKDLQQSVQNTQKGKRTDSNELEIFITQYRNLFPKGKIGTKPYRSTPKDIKDRLLWFQKTYPEFWNFDLMLEATREYFKYIKSSNSKMIKTAGYFIRKVDEGKTNQSTLAEFITMIKEENLSNDAQTQAGNTEFFDPLDGVAR